MSERPPTEVRTSAGIPIESQATVIIQCLDLLEQKTDVLDAKVDRIQIHVAETKGRLPHMPTTWGILGIVATIFGLAIALVGSVLVLIRLPPHL